MSHPAHILVVEDEQHLADGIRYNLVAEGYRVSTVGDGPAALRILRENPRAVDLVILDLMLPGMSGYAVCEEIRRTDVAIPILILTARTLIEDRTRGFEVGANQYLTKPFDLDEFLVRVKNLLTLHGRDKQPPPTKTIVRFAFADAEINFESFDVTVRGEPVRMTQLEMSLLKYFIEHEGRVIPRSELLEKIWGLPGNLHTRAPDQFIRRLRKIFEPDPAQPVHFLTFRDAGYRFIAQPEGEGTRDEG
ncbi:MAG: response regulator transcription factor [Pirellulales bacterium]|nr:response regulator transcription factor [Pirellulales bacterium]